MQWRNVMARIKREVAYYRLIAADSRTPWLSKVLIGVALAYLLSPIDLIPDFIPVLGHLDDVLVVPGLIWLALWLVPQSVKLHARAAAKL